MTKTNHRAGSSRTRCFPAVAVLALSGALGVFWSGPTSSRTASAASAPRGFVIEPEWTDLFNGKDLTGWSVFPAPKDAAANPWTVSEGVLSCAGQPIGYIQTEKTYESFELELDWRFDPTKGAGNSGVLLRVVGEDQVWPKSMEAQLHSENAGDIWNIGEFPATVDAARTQGRRTIKNYPSNEKPLGEWNHYRIVYDGPTLMLFVNGTLQNVATHCEAVPGRLALQSEGAYIQFRNVRIKVIRAAD